VFCDRNISCLAPACPGQEVGGTLLIDFWQHIPEHINPAFLEIGSFQLRYYGFTYLIAFLTVYFLVIYRINDEDIGWSKETVQDYSVWAIAGLLIGARLGYVLFYNPEYYAAHPLSILFPFDLSDGFRFVGISGPMNTAARWKIVFAWYAN